jgi:DNA-binding CsgD family transcriptional regulator
MRKNDHSRTHNTTRTNPFGLTDRELEVADLMISLGCIQGIARTLDIHKNSAGKHTARVAKKLGVKNRWLAAIAWDRYRRQPIKQTAVNSIFQMGDMATAALQIHSGLSTQC